MKTREQQELERILKYNKADIASMLVTVQSTSAEDTQRYRAEIAALKAELKGQERVLKIIDQMSGEANFGLKIQR